MKYYRYMQIPDDEAGIGARITYKSPEVNSGLCMFPYPKTNECNKLTFIKSSANKYLPGITRSAGEM